MTSLFLLVGALMLMLSILLSPLSNRVGMPVLLLFLGVGMLAGEDGIGHIQFDDFETAFLVGNLALAVILLDGGMRTRGETFRVGLRPALLLATIGVLVTALITGLAAMLIFDLPLIDALLAGTIVSSTDAAAVFALLQGRGLNLNARVGATLEIESGSNDPMAIFLTLVLIELITLGEAASLWSAPLMLIQQFGIGVLCGWLGGRLLVFLINRVDLVTALYPLLVTASGLVIFAGTNALGGSGFLAIYLAGVLLGNHRVRMMPAILQVHDGLAWLAQLCLFLILGLLVDPSELLVIAPAGLLLAAVLILLARPMATFGTLWPFRFNLRETSFIAWTGLRGAVPIVLALFPVMAGIEQAPLLFNIAFVIVLVSLVIQGTSLAPVARLLKLEVPGHEEAHRRIPIDVPAVGEHELLLFRLQGERWTRPAPLGGLRLPPDSGIAAVFRDGSYLPPLAETCLQDGDLIAVVGRPDQIDTLGHQFNAPHGPKHLAEMAFFGEFVLNGEALLSDVEQAYGIRIGEEDKQQTLSACIARHQHGHPVVGDSLMLGPVTLVVKEIEGDSVTRVGLKLH
ncbi:K(+)/H(+) antiporter NhaP2 [Marinobacterium nitratireducens]|uniref:K(+)/H(+) antiporter NhaP2 n=1 Tax=Marinobacterium nitratireducens TaxID=518897 RepID=A0A917ZP62_9GAMM|nr:potassium/proton antiporter [Marinobacterium nitratireducens]GGO86629.1 K(+)/H(+) antiporter NhaP2 [Marinobacterium nitratireducens]